MLPVGRFFGVPIYFAPSWLLVAALLTVYYAPIVHDAVPDVSASTSYLLAATFAVLFALCVLAHELGHTAVSLALGNPVRRVVIFLLGGVSEIERDPDRPRDEFLVAAAGPLVSLLITGAAAGGYQFVDGATPARRAHRPAVLEQPHRRRVQPAARPAARRRAGCCGPRSGPPARPG